MNCQSHSQSSQASWSAGSRPGTLGYWNFYHRNPVATSSLHYPSLSPGDHPLTKKTVDSGYKLIYS